MQRNRSRWVWVRFALAVLLGLVIFGAIYPNLARPVPDLTTSPPTYHFVTRPDDVEYLIGVIAVPLLLIVVGALWVALLECIGWVLLGALIVMSFFG